MSTCKNTTNCSSLERLLEMMTEMDKLTPVERKQKWPECTALAKQVESEYERLMNDLEAEKFVYDIQQSLLSLLSHVGGKTANEYI